MAFVLEQVTKAYQDGTTQRSVIENFSYDFTAYQSVCIAGPSGSGKSTLLGLLSGLLAPDAGSIHFKHQDLKLDIGAASSRRVREYRRDHVGFVYQFFNLIPTLTVLENVLLPLQLTKRTELKAVAVERLHTLGLADRIHALPEELSGGEQQRVAVARAFAHGPQVILADEPTGNLDQDNAKEVIELLWRETEKTNAMLIVASHDQNVQQRSESVLRLS